MNNKKTIKFTKSADGYPALLVGFAWAANPLLYYIGIFADKAGIGSGLFITLLFLFLGVKSIDYLRKTINNSDIIVLVLFVGVFLSTYVLFPENKGPLDKYKDYFYLAIPYYIIGRVYSDHDMRDCLSRFSYVCIAAMAVYFLFWGKRTGSLEDVTDSIFSSYMLLPHVLMMVLTAIKKHSVSSIVFLLSGVFLILSFGARGPLLCFFIFCAALIVIVSPFKNKVLGNSITIGAISIIIVKFDRILVSLHDLISSIGMSTRIFDYYAMGMISDDSSRGYIRKMALDALKDHLITGLGLGGDARAIGGYSHNVIVEFLTSFGIIAGSILLLLLFVLYYRSFRSCRTSGQKEMWLLLVVCGFVQLLLSGTFITSPFFYMTLGYCITLVRNKHYN